MSQLVASGAERDQVFGAVMPELTPQLDVMNLQVLDCATILAAPSIPLENLPTKDLVCLCFEAYSGLFGS